MGATVFGVALGVTLGLIIFAALFTASLYVWDYLKKKRKKEAEKSTLQLELEEAKAQLAKVSERSRRQIQQLRGENSTLGRKLRVAEAKLKERVPPPEVPRPRHSRSSWERLDGE